VTRVTPIPFPEGVASPGAALAFVELRDGAVCAVDLATGGDRWRVAVAARPRLVVDRRLIAQDRPGSRGNVLQLLALNLDRHGELERRFDPLVFEDWVAVDDPELEFDTAMWAEDGNLVVIWRAESHYVGGAPPTPSIQAAARHEARGHARLDLHTGRVTQAPVAAEGISGLPERMTAAIPAEAAALVPVGGHSAAVIDARLFYLVEPARPSEDGPRLVGVDVPSGRRIWERILPGRPGARPALRRM
jgi:hypothetical protein